VKTLLLAITVVLGTSSVLAAEPRLAPNAPQDKPKRAEVSKMEQAIAPYVEQARKSWPEAKKRYLAGLPKGEIFFTTVKLAEGDRVEQCFVRVTRVQAGKITGTIASDLLSLKKLHNGDVVTFNETELVDWMIAKPDGTEEGNVVGKFLDTWNQR
jgi:uncharacterized protein YegJ (DUF2314 family)